ncbi:DUF3797 domain-containing protein [Paenibacillus sp. NPDC058177]|uniref:DUF3797 domain-containing protein n=1 Tax=Paenibacillus sp. NPDC058177 TaxID=3346369 RepID=UPI0036DE4E6C
MLHETTEIGRAPGQYTKCPECGNEALGQGEGALHAFDKTFIRKCKCGLEVSITESQ